MVVAWQTARLRLISVARVARGLGRAGSGGAEIVDVVDDVTEAPEPFPAERRRACAQQPATRSGRYRPWWRRRRRWFGLLPLVEILPRVLRVAVSVRLW